MKIYTCTGDNGSTSICGGQRLRKDSPRIEAYGTIDELNSILGIISTNELTPHDDKIFIYKIQNILFNIGSYMAGIPNPGVTDTDVKSLELDIDKRDANLPPLRNFILPGGTRLASYTHLARTVCRRAERRIISAQIEIEVPQIIVKYINRLSDWLFIYARYVNAKANVDEIFWEKPV